MAAKLTRMTHKIVIQLHLVADSCTICCSCSRWPVQILLDMHFYAYRSLNKWSRKTQNYCCYYYYYFSFFLEILLTSLGIQARRLHRKLFTAWSSCCSVIQTWNL